MRLANYTLKARNTDTTITLRIWQADHLAGALAIACCPIAQWGSLLGRLGVRLGELSTRHPNCILISLESVIHSAQILNKSRMQYTTIYETLFRFSCITYFDVYYWKYKLSVSNAMSIQMSQNVSVWNQWEESVVLCFMTRARGMYVCPVPFQQHQCNFGFLAANRQGKRLQDSFITRNYINALWEFRERFHQSFYTVFRTLYSSGFSRISLVV
jgi:hypothetical protein